jgi:hypothetical protein
VVIGMAMCSRGIGYVGALGAWVHPLAILGYLVGALILVIAGSAVMGIPLPWIASPQHAILAVSILTAVKLAFSAFHRF